MALEGRTAIVTGGATGIGKAVARRFLTGGAAVVIADHDEQAGEAAVSELEALGNVSLVVADISESLDVHNLVAETLDVHEAIDILVNAACVRRPTGFLDLGEQDFDAVVRVNLKGTFLCGQAVARAMVRHVEEGGPPGTIVNLSSINARLARPEQLPFCVSMAGIAQMTSVMAMALAPYRIRVNAVAPGTLREEARSADREARRRILQRTPLGRGGEPEEIAGVAAFLVSEDAGYVTGQTIYADGGRLPLDESLPE